MSRGLPCGRPGIRFVLYLAIALSAALLAGCGGDKEEEYFDMSSQRMVPDQTPDSTATGAEETSLEESSYQAGTLTADQGVSGSVETGDEVEARPEAELKAAPAPSSAAPVTAKSRPATASSASPGAEVYSLQLGSFTNQANARQQADRITALGYAPVIEETVLAGQTYHRVMLKNVGDMGEASRLGEHIHSELDIAYLVRRAK